MITRLKFRHGTSAEWQAYNPTLADGEPGYDSTLKRMKIGDGTQPWSALDYVTVDSAALTALAAQVDAAVIAAQAAAATAQGTTGREVANGVAGLDAQGKLYETRLPARLSDENLATFLNRANHTGTQPLTSITGMSTFGQQVVSAASAAALKGTLQINLVDNVPDLSKPVSIAQNQAIQLARQAAEALTLNRQNHIGTQNVDTISNIEDWFVSMLKKYKVAYTPIGSTPPPDPDPEPEPEPEPVVTGAPLSVDAVPQSDGSIKVFWSPPTSIPSGKTVAGYIPFRDQPNWPDTATFTAIPHSSAGYTLTNFVTTSTYKIGVYTKFTDGSLSPLAYESNVSIGSTTPPVVVDPGGGTTDPGGTTSSAPMAYPAHGIGMYHMMYTKTDWPSVSSTPANVNNLRLAFMIDPGPAIVGTGSDGANLGTRLKALRAKGVRIIMSFGGAQNTVNMSNTTGIINAMMTFSNNVCPLDGWDIDLEGSSAPSGSQAVSIARTMRTNRGANFATTMAPNGSNIAVYYTVAQALNTAGLLSAFGQQFYDAPVSDSAMKGRMSEYVGKGLPISKYELGMMSGPTGYAPLTSYWDVQTMKDRLNSAKAAYPSLGGAYYWESDRSTASQYASEVGGIIKTW